VGEHTLPDSIAAAQCYRAMYLPLATIMREKAVDRLDAYVHAGGTLVCADPQAFSFDIDGTDLSARREALTGARLGEPVQAVSCRVIANSLLPQLVGTRIRLQGEAFALDPTDAEVIAVYRSGEPAITWAPRAAGGCLYFGFSIFPRDARSPHWHYLAERVVLDEGWRGFFHALNDKLGIRMDRDIWRFRYPAPEEPEQPALVCLTGNAVRWEGEQPHFERNRPVPGTYSYTVAPDLTADVGAQDVAFTDGNLTDRKDAAHPSADPAVEPYVAAWQTTEPVQITFDLTKPSDISYAYVVFSGYLPATVLRVSADGRAWTDAAATGSRDANEDVLSVTLETPPGVFRYVRLDFGERPAGKLFQLCEVDIWGPG